MKSKFFRYFTAIALSFTYLFSPLIALAVEDFGTWTIVTDDTITDNGTALYFTDLTRDEDDYAYKDLGSGNFTDDFVVLFTYSITEGVADSLLHLVSVANILDDWKGIDDIANNGLGVRHFVDAYSNITLKIIELDSGTEYTSLPYAPNILSEYACVFMRDESVGTHGTAYLYIYSDEEKTTLLDTLSLALHTSKKDYRYVFAAQSYNNGSPQVTSGYIKNVMTSNVIEPEVETLDAINFAYDEVFDSYTADLVGNITEDGGENVTAGFLYRDVTDDDDWMGSSPASGTYGTGANFTVQINELELSHEYEFFAVIENSYASDNGSTESFTCELEAGLPILETLMYPMGLDSDNLSARLYGKVNWDGTSNVTGWIQYKESDNATWIDGDNTTDLVNLDAFSSNITGLTLYTYYDYRAAGVNDNGTAYAPSYGTFILGLETTTPEVTTVGTQFLTSSSVMFIGELTDGGILTGEVLVFGYFEYRKTGTTPWIKTNGYWIPESENYTITRTGLTPSTTYDYRAVCYNYNEDFTKNYGYGDTKLFSTFGEATIPIMSTDSAVFLTAGTVSVTGSIVYDGGSLVDIWFEAKSQNEFIWTASDTILPDYETGDEGSWYITGLVDNEIYQVRVVGQNTQGTGYGNILSFTMSEDMDTDNPPVDDDGIDVITGFSDVIDDIKENLHLQGQMGTWAFLVFALLAVAIVFGIAMVSSKDEALKKCVGFVWALVSMGVFGAFIFTGQLGIWPILILVGGCVVFVFVVVSTILGGRSNG